jgi:hypothetical protein
MQLQYSDKILINLYAVNIRIAWPHKKKSRLTDKDCSENNRGFSKPLKKQLEISK